MDQKYNGVMRNVTVYPEVGIIKHQSNWGQYKDHVVFDL